MEGDSELGLEIDLGDGCKVQHVSTSYQGKYFQRSDNAMKMNMPTLTTISMIYDRKFSVWLPDGGIRQVGLQHLHLHVDVDDNDV